MMDAFLNQLAGKLGVADSFCDTGLCRRSYAVDEGTVKFLCRQLGYPAGSVPEIAKSLDDFDKARWLKAMESVYVASPENIRFDVVVPAADRAAKFELYLNKKGEKKNISVPFEVVRTPDERYIGKTNYVRLEIVVRARLDIGYYDISFGYDKKIFKSTLAVAPDKCYEPEAFEEGRAWGFAVQLYSLKSEHNWGVGDFSDLCALVKIAARAGADVIGLNPLNVLQHNYPEEASPYSSISRLFLNPIYIDVPGVPEFKPADLKPVKAQVEALRRSELIRYSEAYILKIEVLRKLYERFLKSGDKNRLEAYEHFCKEKGAELDKLAIFQSLYDDLHDKVWGGWRAWEEELKNPLSAKVREYARKNEKEIGFFKYLQFEAARQLCAANDLVEKCGLRVGFYRDLPVGVGQDSVELWSNPDLFVKGAGAGAPPDAFFANGQKWGLGAFNPFVLKDMAYQPFVEILRAAMESAGALRIDHVMGLMRLYVVPDHKEQGTYLHYNFDEMLAIVALESHLNRCAVVGESIGNVPDGFMEKIRDKNIRSLSVLWAERWDLGGGMFKNPGDYPAGAFVSVGTHDMPPLKMWWFGCDISLNRSLGLMKSDEEMNAAYHRREHDRKFLLDALDYNQTWPHDNLRKADDLYGEAYPEGIEEAVHRYIARSPSTVFLAELENILHVGQLQNLPGVDRNIYPNWRHKLPVPLERLETETAFVRNLKAIKLER